MKTITLVLLLTILHTAWSQYPCRRAVILAMDMSSAIGSVDNQTLFNQQKNAVWTAYHLWELSDAAIRVMLPAPNGLGVTDEIFSELHDNIIELDDIMTRIIDADGQAYQPSDLPRQIEYLGSNFDLNYDETVKYILVLFSGTTNQAEIKNATTMYKNIFDEKNIEIIVVTVGPTTADFSQLGSDAVLQLSDPDFYFTLTNEICDGVVENTPTGAPTPVPEPVYPAESDLFIIFSISDCPISSQISSQVTLTKEMLKNFTFQENGIRAAVPTPIGMTFYGNNMLWYSRDMVFSEIDSIKGYSSVSGFCQQGSISDALKNINDNLRIKDNSSAVVLLFVDSADTTDIASSATFRKCSFDPRGVQVVTIELYGSASTVDLATPNLNFKIDDSNLQTEIVNAIINAPIYNDITIGNC